jgi:predicted nuclease with TOPRIM domain
MEIDPEEKFLREYAKIEALEADVEILQGNIKKLRAENKKLSEKISGFEIQGFNEQIAALDKKVYDLGKSILLTQRMVAFDRANTLQLHMIQIADIQFGKGTTPQQAIREHMIAEMAKVTVAVESSSEPLEIATKFRIDCVEYSKKMHLKSFRE